GRQVAEPVEQPDRDRGTDRHAGRRRRRLLEEGEAGGRRRGDGEEGGRGAGDAAGAAQDRRGGAGGVERQLGEGRRSVGDGSGRRAGGGETARSGRDRQSDVIGVVVAGEVAEPVVHLHGDRRADGHAGLDVRRLLEEAQVVGRRRVDGEGARRGAGDAAGAA